MFRVYVLPFRVILVCGLKSDIFSSLRMPDNGLDSVVFFNLLNVSVIQLLTAFILAACVLTFFSLLNVSVM